MSEQALLKISQLGIHFHTDKGKVKAVDGVDLTVQETEIVGIVGESGCGKSVTSLSIMGLVPQPPGEITGSIRFNNEDLTRVSDRKMRALRGNEIAMIFQEPMTSLNPVFTIGDQMIETIRIHTRVSKREASARALEMLDKVGITRKGILKEYPHQLSGGMRQRVMIAMAMVLQPRLLIADEPTTALDVTIQAQILDLMRELNQEFKTAIMLITHDMGVVAEMCDRIVVMYAGQIVEEAKSRQLFQKPTHPYTQGLLKSIPNINNKKSERLYSIPGQVPSPIQMPTGCRFADRCEHVMSKCIEEAPPLIESDTQHYSRCWLYGAEEEADKNGISNALASS
ncbi:ABC transporter ATP-binding protein [Mechercharimyces sp. CAU 1602]|uniref:ABC transporter ATP-binding protein n=1 Tax=Mechercharimyces sp. CAU 1602 TaxID=2973933 RepID=UPI00216193FA|nr:ABC transporter ATP-binding protein [Mechercharimyces sp. CAU 1602]MCS1351801.1 ABC transporter ATP-binding protein [Mechercharimyces sp. CAU 1602]